MGQGIDRHLLGLKLQAIEEGLSVPRIFMDTAYGLATHWKLRTGQVTVLHSIKPAIINQNSLDLLTYIRAHCTIKHPVRFRTQNYLVSLQTAASLPV